MKKKHPVCTYIRQFIVYSFLDLNLCDFSPGASMYGKKDEGVGTGEEADDEEDKASAPPLVSRPGDN